MRILLWEVCLHRAPTVDKYCKRCDRKSEFESSGLFRVNSQQKNLEIWHIYKCQICDTTWNLTVFSHLNSKSINQGLLERYANNDYDLALLHATDTALIKRNGTKCNVADAYITGEDYVPYETAEIRLSTGWSLENKAATLIRQKLCLSANQFDRLIIEGRIISLSGHNLMKCKMSGTIIFQVKPHS